MKGIAQPFTSITSQVKFKASAAPEKSAPVAGRGGEDEFYHNWSFSLRYETREISKCRVLEKSPEK